MRPTAALTTTALTAAAALGATSAAQAAPAVDEAAAAKAHAELRLSIEPLWSGTGEQVRITGELYNADTYRPLGNRGVRIESKPTGTSRWSTYARIETNSAGTYSLAIRPDRSRTYRVVYSGNAWYYAESSRWVSQVARPGTKVRLSGKLRSDGTGTRITGRATKLWSSTIRPLKGVSIWIQYAKPYSDYFADAKKVQTSSQGYYTWKTSVPPNRCYRYRAIYKGNSTWAAKSTIARWSACT